MVLDLEKEKPLINVIGHQPCIGEMYLYANYPSEAKYQVLINKFGGSGLEHLNDSEAFIKYSIGIIDIYKYIEEYNRNKKHIILIVFDDMIPDTLILNFWQRSFKRSNTRHILEEIIL